jgi:hypothetical protein
MANPSMLRLKVTTDSSALNGYCINTRGSLRRLTMRTKRMPESDEQLRDRLDKDLRDRRKRVSADDEAVDAAVRRSISQYGP